MPKRQAKKGCKAFWVVEAGKARSCKKGWPDYRNMESAMKLEIRMSGWK